MDGGISCTAHGSVACSNPANMACTKVTGSSRAHDPAACALSISLTYPLPPRLVAAQQWVLAVRIATSLRHAFPTLLGADPASVTGGAGGAGSSRAAATGGAVQAGHTGAGPSPVLAALASGTATSGLSSAAASAALQEFVLSQWACAKISAAAAGQGAGGQQGDAEIKEELMPKLRTCPTIKFAPLAAHAQVLVWCWSLQRISFFFLQPHHGVQLRV